MSASFKFCFICEDDLSDRKRIKDSAGNYFCPACWEARKSMEEPATASTAATKAMTASTATATPRVTAPSTPPQASADPNFVSWPKKLGLLTLAAAIFAYCDAWPLYQATHHADEFSISFNEMAAGWAALFVALFVMLAGPLGISRRLYIGKPMTESQRKRAKIVGFVFATAVMGLAYAEQTYIEHLGYTVRPWYETSKPAHH